MANDKLNPPPKYGQVWKTKNGHRVRINIGANPTIIEAVYVDGPVQGYRGANFDLNGMAVRDDDQLLGREE